MSSRTIAVWCPDWPAVAAGILAGLSPSEPVAVLAANRVVTCSATARSFGVVRGLRRREAQSRCPELHIHKADRDRDARLFEPVVAALEAVAPGVEILRPGLMGLSARGPRRYFGTEEGAAQQLIDAVGSVGVECQIGIADELATAIFAARRSKLVPHTGSRRFLAPLPIVELAAEPSLLPPDIEELVGLLTRLGLVTIGDFAMLKATDVGSRFGLSAIAAHRIAQAQPYRSTSARTIPPEWEVEYEPDPPIDRVDAAAFVGRTMATQLHTKLSSAGVACTRLIVTARTESGESFSRTWRCAQPLTPEATADRIRWQLDGWLTGQRERRPDAPITYLQLCPVEVVNAGELQLGLWGGVGEETEAVRRALTRVQGLLGGDAVQIPVLNGGRGPHERMHTVPFGDERIARQDSSQPWPGRLPAPAPVQVYPDPAEVLLHDAAGTAVRVTERGFFSSDPAVLTCPTDVRFSGRLEAWAGPWPVVERWWDADEALNAARAQVVVRSSQNDHTAALLLLHRDGSWGIEGAYI